MNCPFCRQELLLSSLRDGDEEHQMWHCLSCQLSAQGKLWQELIRTRKALEIAVDMLTRITVSPETMMEPEKVVPYLADLALKQITALEQKDE